MVLSIGWTGLVGLWEDIPVCRWYQCEEVPDSIIILMLYCWGWGKGVNVSLVDGGVVGCNSMWVVVMLNGTYLFISDGIIIFWFLPLIL